MPVGLCELPDVAGDDGDRQVARGFRQLLERRFRVLDEAALFHQVARRIAGDARVPGKRSVRAARRRLARKTDHQRHIARKVADRGIDLPEGDPHEPSV